MYDFNKFIELMNSKELISDSAKVALDSIKDIFYIGKVAAKSTALLDCIEYTLADYEEEPLVTYNAAGYEYLFYTNKYNHKYSDEEIDDIKLLLKLLSLYHANYKLIKKVEDAELMSPNTKLPNAQGYMKRVKVLANFVDVTKYNSYFINIKGFALVNKLFGSSQGDKVIYSYASRLGRFVEKDEVVGHVGGDNFVAFIKRTRHQKFIDLVTMCPVEVEKDGVKKKLELIGITGYYELNSNDLASGTILSHASMACQYARNNKKIVVQLTSELMDMVNSVKNIEGTFKDELKNGNFVVYYQPKFDIKSGKIIGVEALSRWKHNDKIISPDIFVPILEKNGEIVELDLYVLENLCKDIHNFRNMGHKIVPASCNLSRRDFEIPDIEKRVINIIKSYNVKSRDIVIEVTETTNIEENARLSKFIRAMTEAGIMTSIDDFGTGYSSLSVLRDCKVSEIKIDRSFINKEALTNSDEIIIGSIIDMAKRLDIAVICEGVETKFQADFLMRLGCFNAQGFLYSKPVPKLEFEDMLLKIGTLNAN